VEDFVSLFNHINLYLSRGSTSSMLNISGGWKFLRRKIEPMAIVAIPKNACLMDVYREEGHEIPNLGEHYDNNFSHRIVPLLCLVAFETNAFLINMFTTALKPLLFFIYCQLVQNQPGV
jgi:hypothetical protein